MISFCCPFYPWYRQFDRTNEIFDVLARGLKKIRQSSNINIELSIVNSGVIDVWGNGREFDNNLFLEKLFNSFDGNIKYIFDDISIHIDKNGTKRFWVSSGVDRAIKNASNKYIVICGIDCYFDVDFIKNYMERVNEKSTWVILATICNNVGDIENYKSGKLKRKFYSARGIVGITKDNYNLVGGYDCSYIKNRSDSVFYESLIANNEKNFKVIEERVDCVYHIFHPGSNMKMGI